MNELCLRYRAHPQMSDDEIAYLKDRMRREMVQKLGTLLADGNAYVIQLGQPHELPYRFDGYSPLIYELHAIVQPAEVSSHRYGARRFFEMSTPDSWLWHEAPTIEEYQLWRYLDKLAQGREYCCLDGGNRMYHREGQKWVKVW